MQRPRTRQLGFTLMELMIVVVIVGILMMIAIPAYQDSVTRTWRTKATACLTEMSQGMERRYTTGLSYISDPANPLTLPPQVCTTQENMGEYYAFSFTANPTASLFTLQAVPQGAQASRDARCGTFTINQLGVRGVSGAEPVDSCW